MWRAKEWPRTTLPVPVFLNRLDAPLCVFSFGIQIFLGLDYKSYVNCSSLARLGALWLHAFLLFLSWERLSKIGSEKTVAMTITVKSIRDLVIPPSVRRHAGIKAGDRLEFRASRGLITIVATPGNAPAEYTPRQRRALDREIVKGLEDIRKGRVYGPFTAQEASRFIKTELKTRSRKTKVR
jgi:bifunctional DNA-binding transcriptional regulator/antitoxin component of YhaV-PrlF toxin-antitoxin module